MSSYLFTTRRLGFRTWKEADSSSLHEINSDDAVMEFFPGKPSEEDTHNFIVRMQGQFVEEGFCYFAVDVLEKKEFIGFIGLSVQSFTADFTPCIDIGWRLKRSAWNKGYATEGALGCLDYGFNNLGLEEIYALAPLLNVKSEAIMKKIGMKRCKTFEHPRLLLHERLKECVLYRKKKAEHTVS